MFQNTREVPLFGRIYLLYLSAHRYLRSLQKIERHTLGEKIDNEIFNLLRAISKIKYAHRENKIYELDRILETADFIKVIFRVMNELDILPINKYIDFVKLADEIGRMSNGYKKYLLIK